MAVRDIVQAAAGALGGAAGEALYVEDVFSTYLYTGNGQGQYIKNGILLGDSATNGTHLHLTGDNLTDSAPTANTLTVTGNTAVSTSVKKYGTGSIAFDGSGDYITTQTGAEHNLLNDFTIEFWVQSNLGGDQGLFCINKLSGSGQDGIAIRFSGTSLQYWVRGNLTIYTASGSYSSSTWYHIALVRSGNTNTLYANGTSVHTSTATPLFNSSQAIGIGRTYNDNTSYTLNGYIDDLRVTKGRALYTGSFTPPTAALPLDTLSTGEGGLVWLKRRSSALSHWLLDTNRGGSSILQSDNTNAAFSSTAVSFLSDGFSLDSANYNLINDTFASWTWRKCPKFFDVVTWTGDGTNPRAISHNLGSVPGCFIVKCTSNSATDWRVYHRTLGAGYNLKLHSTAASDTTQHWANTTPTDTVFYVSSAANVNASGYTYVAYLFAHNDGGFGEDGTENVISCGSWTGNATNDTLVNLGWEPQWILYKAADSGSSDDNWWIYDTMRGMTYTGFAGLYPNLSNAEVNGTSYLLKPDPQGFRLPAGFPNNSGIDFIYIAIRRGLMKTPTDATTVFAVDAGDSSSNSPGFVSNFVVDSVLARPVSGTDNMRLYDRLRGKYEYYTNLTGTEVSSPYASFDFMNGFRNNTANGWYAWMCQRAPGFHDVVAYTGDGVNGRTVNHNLGVKPDMMIVKNRTAAESWVVYNSSLGATKYGFLNGTGSFSTGIFAWNDTEPTSTVFSVYGQARVNDSGNNYVAYLFATLAGVSKVGSYTGTAADLNVDCGFSAGARFILIKRTDSTGDWYLWDSVRGIIAGNDPYLLLNSSAAQVTSTDYIDPLSSGFTVTSSAPAGLNASGGSYIFLAIA